MPTYDWDASDYANNSSQQLDWARILIEQLHLAGDEHLLDVGCGDGKITAEIAASLPRGSALGVDVSQEMITFARRSHPAQRHPNLRFEVQDAARLPFREEFDVVFSNAALHWLTDHHPALAGIARSLRPGGKALLQMGARGNAALVQSVLEYMMRLPGWSVYFEGFTFPYGFFTPEEYIPWLEEAGLQPLRVETVLKDREHAGREELAGWFRSTWLPYTRRIPQDRREEFIAEMTDACLAQNPPDAAGVVHVEMLRLEVEAIKPLKEELV